MRSLAFAAPAALVGSTPFPHRHLHPRRMRSSLCWRLAVGRHLCCYCEELRTEGPGCSPVEEAVGTAVAGVADTAAEAVVAEVVVAEAVGIVPVVAVGIAGNSVDYLVDYSFVEMVALSILHGIVHCFVGHDRRLCLFQLFVLHFHTHMDCKFRVQEH